jgi:hypothetical protein
MTPDVEGGEPPARAAEDPSFPDIVRWLAVSRRRRNRRLTLVAVATIASIATLVAGRFFIQRNEKPLVMSDQPARAVAGPQVMPPSSEPAPSPSPRVDRSPSSRQIFGEVFVGRDRRHSVTAAVDNNTVSIHSSRPGYVYVLALANQSDVANPSIAVLFPTAVETSNHIEPGQALTLPAREWPTNARFLALVSDEPRHMDGPGPLVATVICASITPCSESYGAVVFSRDSPRDTAHQRAIMTTPAARPRPEASRRCSDILERASLGEALTDDEQLFLRRDCR